MTESADFDYFMHLTFLKKGGTRMDPPSPAGTTWPDGFPPFRDDSAEAGPAGGRLPLPASPSSPVLEDASRTSSAHYRFFQSS